MARLSWPDGRVIDVGGKSFRPPRFAAARITLLAIATLVLLFTSHHQGGTPFALRGGQASGVSQSTA